jgi:biopolymer transport protein ExbB
MQAFLDFIGDHLFFAVLMFGMTLIAGVLVVWRLLLNFTIKTDMNWLLPQLQEVLNKHGIEGGLKMCRSQPESQVIPQKLYVAGLEAARQGPAAMRRAMNHSIELDIVPRLNFLLPSILAIAKIATMVGLLGTVISMIGTFQELGKAGEGGAAKSSASREIGLALFATALGLMAAIPLVFSHVLFKAWTQKFEIALKSAAHKLITLVQAMRSGGQARAPAGAARRGGED